MLLLYSKVINQGQDLVRAVVALIAQIQGLLKSKNKWSPKMDN